MAVMDRRWIEDSILCIVGVFLCRQRHFLLYCIRSLHTSVQACRGRDLTFDWQLKPCPWHRRDSEAKLASLSSSLSLLYQLTISYRRATLLHAWFLHTSRLIIHTFIFHTNSTSSACFYSHMIFFKVPFFTRLYMNHFLWFISFHVIFLMWFIHFHIIYLFTWN